MLLKLTERYKEAFDTEDWSIYKVLSHQFYRDTSNYEEMEAAFKTNIKRYYERYHIGQMDSLMQHLNSIISILGYREADMGEGLEILCIFLADDKESYGRLFLLSLNLEKTLNFGRKC